MAAHLPSANTRSGIAVLLALFTLLCAICPLGLPASQKLGPAFNPANEAVTVRPDARLPVARATAERPDPVGPLPIAQAAAPVVPARATVRPDISLQPAALPSLPGLSPFAARAPPARA